MPNPHLDATGTPWTMSTPTTTNVSTSLWSPAAGRDESGYLSTSPHYDPGHDSDAGQYNTGVSVLSSDDMINETITADTTPTSTKPNSVTNVYGEEVDLTNISDDIWNLAKQAADPVTNPGYALSYEGQQLKDRGILPGSDQWVAHFGIPQLVMTSTTGEPMLSTEGDKPMMSGQGKYLMDQYDDPKTYEEKVDAYYKMREVEQAQQTGGDQGYGYGYGHGSSGVGGSYASAFGMPGFPQIASAQDRHKAYLAQLYRGRQYQDFSGKEVHKMLDFDQKVEAANILSRLSQGAQAFEMDPKRRGILAVLQA